ncbi:hypothetical protein [Streptomyces jumonjinensis]|uniref:Uncharacterized protein n=1 Tax=Streptomyces jumonjinensis TaxID=1945 RepID=A0A646KTF1_STRJU|nr:hypothetical protein [Streptomyces jumonjinensis]MQT05574.1 hypothetical protein [Streptomyces jumonjinensis]
MDLVLSAAAAIVLLGAVGRTAAAARRGLERMVRDIVARTLAGQDRWGREGAPAGPAASGRGPADGPFGGAGVSRHGGRGER